MRHGVWGAKLNRTASHRRAMFANMAIALVKHEQIKTTLPKARALGPYVEKLITMAKRQMSKKRDDLLAVRRMILSKLRDSDAANKIFELAARYESRNGGYTRIVKAGFRFGDAASMAYIGFMDKK